MKVGQIGLRFVVSFVQKDIRKRRKTYPSRDEFTYFADVPYIDDNNKFHTYDVYLADKSNRKNCCFIDIHGGSYVFGEHYDNFPYAYPLLKAGYDVVLVDYLPNDGKMDISDLVNDCALNITHLANNLAKYGLLDDKFIMTGDSAGGHLALLISLALQNKEVKDAIGVSLPELPLIGTVIACPVYNYAKIGEDSISKSALKRMKGPKFNDVEHMNRFSAHTYIKYNRLPLLLSTCKLDFIRGESLALNEDMKDKDGYVFVDIDSNDKKIDHVHNVTKPYLKESIEVNDAVVEFADKLL